MKRARVLAPLLVASCILPDYDIVLIDAAITNKHAVRFVEPVPLTPAASAACDANLKDTIEVCQPQDPATVLPHFLDPALEAYKFCSCAPGEVDLKRLPATNLYVEDRKDEVNVPLVLYAAVLLDLDPADINPHRATTYEDWVFPEEPLELPESLEFVPPKRPPVELYQLRLGDNDGDKSNRIDLCNGAFNAPLARGFHTFRVVVTDRQWYSPPDSSILYYGVPDLANGATYDVLSYTFFCHSKDDPVDLENLCSAQCVPPGESL